KQSVESLEHPGHLLGLMLLDAGAERKVCARALEGDRFQRGRAGVARDRVVEPGEHLRIEHVGLWCVQGEVEPAAVVAQLDADLRAAHRWTSKSGSNTGRLDMRPACSAPITALTWLIGWHSTSGPMAMVPSSTMPTTAG